MANAANGEPLGYRHAVVLYSGQSARGTAVTPASAAGLAAVRLLEQGNTRRFRGPGSANLAARKGGETYTDWDLRLDAVQTGAKGLLQKAARVGGVLPWLTLGIGYQDDVTPTPNREADQVQDCKVERLRLRLDAGRGPAPLAADLRGIGGLITTLTSLVPANLGSAPWMSYEAVMTQEGAPFECRGFELDVDHHLRRDHVLPGAVPAAFPRGFAYLTEQEEVITGRVSRYARSAVNVQASTVSEYDLALVLTSQSDASVLTITLTDLDYDTRQVDEDERGIFWTYPFEAKTWSLT